MFELVAYLCHLEGKAQNVAWNHTEHLASNINMMEDYGSEYVELTINSKRLVDTKLSVMVACEKGHDTRTVFLPKVFLFLTLPVRNFFTLKPY